MIKYDNGICKIIKENGFLYLVTTQGIVEVPEKWSALQSLIEQFIMKNDEKSLHKIATNVLQSEKFRRVLF